MPLERVDLSDQEGPGRQCQSGELDCLATIDPEQLGSAGIQFPRIQARLRGSPVGQQIHGDIANLGKKSGS